MSDGKTGLKYRPEIDGLRTLAVLPVVLFHLGYSFVSGGYYGVDVFFVISGYLITGILTKSIQEGRFSMYQFWVRRVKRLLPALLTVVLCMLIVAPVFIFRPVVREMLDDVFPAIFSYFNFHALTNFGNYWGTKSNSSFFLHVWSLSVEEQFYLIYPFFLYLVYRYFRNLTVPLLIVTLVSFLVFVFCLRDHRDFAFYMLPSRMWELSLGGLISLVGTHRVIRHRTAPFLAMFGVLLIVAGYFVGGAVISARALLPTCGTALVILFATADNFVGRALSGKSFVYIGKLSYSVYLWHWPLIVLFNNLEYQLHHVNRHLINVLIFTLTLLLSHLTYAFVEQRTRNYKHTPKFVLASIGVIGGFVYLLYTNFPVHFQSGYNRVTDYFRCYDISPKQALPEKNSPFTYNMTILARPEKFSDAYKSEGIIERVNDREPEVMLVGDSHGVMWARLLDVICDESGLSRSFYASTASKPFFNLENIDEQTGNGYFSSDQRKAYAKSLTNNIDRWRPQFLVLACKWEGLNEKDKKNLDDFLVYLDQRKIRVVILNQPPRLGFMTNRNAAQFLTYLGFEATNGINYVDLYGNESVIRGNDYLKTLEKKYSFVTVFDVFNKLSVNDKVMVSRDIETLYYDDDHLTFPGTMEFKSGIMDLIGAKSGLLTHADMGGADVCK